MSDWIDVGEAAAIAPGSYDVVEFDDTWVAVFNVEGEYLAIEDVCTHDGAELTGGEVRGCVIECPRHGACFDLRTGEAMTPPAYEATRTYPVKVDDGRIFLKESE
ncbi:MAG: Rieske family ferredoxin [Lysobacteraceae bacterium]|nr:MAG: Rieske family ferredoxin [Xanthomonadaceae bacterium]